MTGHLQDNTVALAALRRLEDEVAELRDAVEKGTRAETVDELVDVAYYHSLVMSASGSTERMVGSMGR